MRSANNRKVYRDYWWQFAEKRPALTQAIADGALGRVLVVARVSKTCLPVLVRSGQVMSEMMVVFPNDQPSMLAWLNSGIHYAWSIARASTLETRIRYTPSDVFETLPLPAMKDAPELARLGDLLDVTRSRTMLDRQLGLTKLYNAVHDSSVHDVEIQQLRDLHEQIDHAVAEAYGWTDLDLTHDFYQSRQGSQRTINPAISSELLDRLLELNHERHAVDTSVTARSTRRSAVKVSPVEDALF